MKKIYSYLAVVVLLFSSVLKSNGQNLPVPFAQASNIGQGCTPPSDYNTGNGASPTLFNFIRSFNPTVPISSTSDQAFNYDQNSTLSSRSATSTIYTSGFGTPLETIVKGSSSTNATPDIIVAHDNRPSLTSTSWLPFTHGTGNKFIQEVFTDQNGYWISPNNFPLTGGTKFTQTITSLDKADPTDFYPTPTTDQYAAGKSYGKSIYANTSIAHTKAMVYSGWAVNGPGIVILTLSPDNKVAVSGMYASNQLSVEDVSSVASGNTQQTVTYYNKDGQLIAKYVRADENNGTTWLITNYVYDDLGRLAYILTPRLYDFYANSPAIVGHNLAIPLTGDSAELSNFAFHYTYDNYGDVITRHVPGEIGDEQIIYDIRQRPVLYQSPLMAKKGQWKFILYDDKNRKIMSGLINNNFMTAAQWRANLAGATSGNNDLYYLENGFSSDAGPANYSIPNAWAGYQVTMCQYYDDYQGDINILQHSTFNTSYAANYTNDNPPVPYMNTHGLLTARKRYIDSSIRNQWVYDIYFYDQQGRVIQVQSLNPFNQPNEHWDCTTTEYTWAGQPEVQIIDHYAFSTFPKPHTTVVKQYFYDIYNHNRLTSSRQRIDNGDWRTLTSLKYDDMGRVNVHNIGGVEEQDLDYDANGNLAAINRNYVFNPPAQPDNQSFGVVLNRDYGFTSPRLDGRLSGIIWRGSAVGSSAGLHAYGYNYDESSRLLGADYSEGTDQYSWANNDHYGVHNISYDKNGNLLTMQQMGDPGMIDDLHYNYYDSTNQLKSVNDNINQDFHLGDFVDNQPGDVYYAYDENGNLMNDLNKGIQTTYNDQNLPVLQSIAPNNPIYSADKGYISNVYAADGQLIEKTINDNGNPMSYLYWGPFVYRHDSLLYVLNEEGRCRWLPDSSIYKYDFFVKDHQGNVRDIVTTDEQTETNYLATYEIATANIESSTFSNVTPIADTRPGIITPDNVQAARLNGLESDRQIGTSIMLHVMSGDKFDLSALSYYDPDSTGNEQQVTPGNLIANLIGTLGTGYGGLGPTENSYELLTEAGNTLNNNIGFFEGVMQQATNPQVPASYINYMVFDENMNLIPDQSGAIQIGSTPGSWQTMATQAPITMHQNGYVVAFISNTSAINTYIDNFHITIIHGRLLEEQHYYPFGLTMQNAGQPFSPMPNKYLLEGNELQDEMRTNLYDFNARQYDPQLGRFCNVDPMAEGLEQEGLSPYHFCGNDPANQTDPLGLGDGDKSTGAQNTLKQSVGTDNDPDAKKIITYGPAGDGEVGQNIIPETNVPDLGYQTNDDPFFLDIDGVLEANPDYVPIPSISIIYSSGTPIQPISSDQMPSIDNTAVAATAYQGMSQSDAGLESMATANISSYSSGPTSGADYSVPSVASRYSTYSGVAASTVERLAGTARVGTNVALYTASATGQVFHGNQYVETFSIAKGAKALGTGAFIFSTFVDLYGVRNYYRNRYDKNSYIVSPQKATLNFAMGAWGFTGVGTLPSILYFGIDALYPGGFDGFMTDGTANMQEIKSIVPNYRVTLPGD